MRIGLRKWVTWYLVATMFVIGITPRVYAGFSPSEEFALTHGERASDLEKVRQFLEMKIVRERMKDLGFTPEEIQGRLQDLTDPQIHQMAQKVDDLKVAGDGWGVVIAILVIIILVILILHLTGHRLIVK